MFTSPNLGRLVTHLLICSLFVAGLSSPTTRVSRASANRLSPSTAPTAIVTTEQTAGPSVPQAKTVDEATRARVREAYVKSPLSFEENRGQVDAEVRYVARGQGYTLFLTQTEAVLSLRRADGEARKEKGRLRRPRDPQVATRAPRSDVLRMKLRGANRSPAVKGESEAGTRVNYFRGNDPKNWHTDVARYERVRYAQIYPGVDVTYYGKQRQLEYDFEVAPGADTKQIALEFSGVRQVQVESETGELVLKSGDGEVRQRRPVTYQEVGGERREVASRYVMRGEREVGFEVGEYDRTRPLVIDPVLTYSTYLGGVNNGDALGRAIAVDASGVAYVAGFTGSTDFPTRNQYQTAQGAGDVFVVKLDTNISGAGALLYSTYLGGTVPPPSIIVLTSPGEDYASDIAVDSAGIVYVTGYTTSLDFPTVNAYQTHGDGGDAFFAKLDTNAAGAASLLYSTYFGGSRDDASRGIAADSAGNAYIAGSTLSSDLPTLHGFQSKQNIASGTYDAFVAKFDTNLAGAASLRYSTYIGGSHEDYGAGIAVDSNGFAYVVGVTESTNFPTRSQFQRDKCDADAFVVKLNTNAPGPIALLYSTYLGGNGYDGGDAIAVDQSGCAYVTGLTMSTDFPTLNGYQPHKEDFRDADAFVAKLDTNLPGRASLLYGTYLGGDSSDDGTDIAADSAGNAYVAGRTSSEDFPTVNPFQRSLGRSRRNYFIESDAFVAKLDTFAQGEDSVVYSTYLGGSDSEGATAIAVDPAGNAYVTGHTYSDDFPTRRPYQGHPARRAILTFVTKLRETSFIGGRVVRGGDSGGEPSGVGGVSVMLTGAQTRWVVTNSEGEFSFPNLEKGDSYKVTLSKGDLTLVPASLDFPNLQGNMRHNVIETRPANLSGRVTVGAADGVGLGGATITLTGGANFTPRTTKTTSYGSYSFNDLPTPGSYRVTASKTSYLFEPAQLTLTNLTTNRVNVNLVARLRNYSIGGVVWLGRTGVGGVTVRLTSPAPAGFAPQTTTTNSAGVYSFPNLPGGRTYTVTPMKAGYRFWLPSQSLVNLSANPTAVNFSVESYNFTGSVTRTGAGP